MKFNIFEGARRIVKILQISWLVGALYLGFTSEPYVTLNYRTWSPTSQFFLTTEECEYDDLSRTVYRTTQNNKKVSVDLCFKSMDFNGSLLIPYKADEKVKDLVWGSDKYSLAVTNYAHYREKYFTLPIQDESKVDKKWWEKKRASIKDGIIYGVVGFIVIYLVTLGIGWIVRGFCSIPNEKDHK